MQSAALCASKILFHLITFISVCVLVKSIVLPKQEETEINGKSHGIMSQCGVFQKALPDKWSNGTMIFRFLIRETVQQSM